MKVTTLELKMDLKCNGCMSLDKEKKKDLEVVCDFDQGTLHALGYADLKFYMHIKDTCTNILHAQYQCKIQHFFNIISL